jgi:GNAT superfamily N-acetyltransferase
MQLEIGEHDAGILKVYREIPTAFEVKTVLKVRAIDGGLGGLAMEEHPLDKPYIKDYDANAPDGPETWSKSFDLSKWGFILASAGNFPVGGAVVAFDTPGLHMLEGRKDLAVLWDIRVRPEWRRRGIGKAVFQRAADWARARNCTQLKIETQNVNVPACRFYSARGCRLEGIVRGAYRDTPAAHEEMLLWYLDL